MAKANLEMRSLLVKKLFCIFLFLAIGLIGIGRLLTQARLIDVAGAAQLSPDFDLGRTIISERQNLQVAASSSTSVNPIKLANALPAILVRIAACESTGDPNGTPRQFHGDGSLLWGNVASGTEVVVLKRDLGEFQINTWLWGATATAMHDDLTTQAGNIAFALWLYSKYGTSPWNASEKCWSQSQGSSADL